MTPAPSIQAVASCSAVPSGFSRESAAEDSRNICCCVVDSATADRPVVSQSSSIPMSGINGGTTSLGWILQPRDLLLADDRECDSSRFDPCSYIPPKQASSACY